MLKNNYEITPGYKSVIKQEISKIHGTIRDLSEADFYPEHEKRKEESTEYKKIHYKLIREMDSCCAICRVRYSILSDSEKRQDKAMNPYQATEMELHHFYIEWALANAIDVNKFNQLLRLRLANLYPECELYKTFMDQDNILAWVDHHEHNLMPLCDVHHRHNYYGIHTVSYPNWNAWNLYRSDFIEEIKEEIKKGTDIENSKI